MRSFFLNGKCGNFFYNLVRNLKFVFNYSVCMVVYNFERNKYSKEMIFFFFKIKSFIYKFVNKYLYIIYIKFFGYLGKI